VCRAAADSATQLSILSVYDPSAPADIRWFSIANAFLLVIFLAVFVALILLRILRRDYLKLEKLQQTQDDIEDAEGTPPPARPPIARCLIRPRADDIGWKRIHTDVFRYPPHRAVFSSLVGVGVQFLCLMVRAAAAVVVVADGAG
jgi:hypothetical protein